jgi:pimeloyl-ACP methyl ester carboxylesterase
VIETEQFELTRDRPNGGKPLAVRGEAYHPAPTDSAAAESPPTVVICHGFKGFAHWAFFPYLARTIAEYGMRAVTFDFSGSGIGADRENFTALEEFTTNTFSQELADLEEVIAESRRRGWIDREFGLFGHSRGGGVAIIHASFDRDVKALVTWAAIASTSRWDEEAVREWRARGYTDIENSRTRQTMRLGTAVLDDVEANGKGKLDVAAAARRISVPWLVVHGDADETVPVKEAEQLSELSTGFSTLWTVEGAGHTFSATHPVTHPPPLLALVTRGTVQFLSEHLTRAAV